MKKLLTKEGYLLKKSTIPKKLKIEIKKDLTVKPYQAFKHHNIKPVQFKVYSENDEYLSIPKFYGLKKLGEPDENHEVKGKKIKVKFNGTPRPKQKDIIKKTIKHMKEKDGGLICVGCGVGKTFMGLYIACHFKVKTLIIVHKTFLLNQWKEIINQFTNAKVGIIQQNKIDIEDLLADLEI